MRMGAEVMFAPPPVAPTVNARAAPRRRALFVVAVLATAPKQECITANGTAACAVTLGPLRGPPTVARSARLAIVLDVCLVEPKRFPLGSADGTLVGCARQLDAPTILSVV
jgi:hypothetical protein